MITDQKTIDALKELNYSQVYEKGKEDAKQEILDKIDKFEKDNTLSIKTEDLVKEKIIVSDYISWKDFRKFKEQLNQPKTEQ